MSAGWVKRWQLSDKRLPPTMNEERGHRAAGMAMGRMFRRVNAGMVPYDLRHAWGARDPQRGDFRPFARRYANGEVHHFLRDRGFLIKKPPSWRELHARGRKLQGAGVPREAVAQRLGVNQSRCEPRCPGGEPGEKKCQGNGQNLPHREDLNRR
jgi:hypothetical protein